MMNTQSSKIDKAYKKLLNVLVFILFSLASFVLYYFSSGGQFREALIGAFFWIWVVSTSAFILHISNKLNKGTMINKLPFVVLLATSLVMGVILVIMDESLPFFSLYVYGITANIAVLVVAVLGLMRERIKLLIILCVAGAFLSISYDYYFHVAYVIPRQEPGVLWHLGMAGYAILGLLFGSALLENSRYGRMAFGLFGVLFINFFFYLNLYALFFLFPLLSLIALLIWLLFVKPMKRRVKSMG